MPPSPDVHHSSAVDPTATIDPSATIGPDNRIGPGVIVGPRVVLGRGNVLHPRCIIQQDVRMGDRNAVHPFAILGGDPQDRAFDADQPGDVEIGSDNIFREYVSIHRATLPDTTSSTTRIGDHNFFMASSHAGHNCVIGSRNTLANGTNLSGHVRLGNDCTFSGGCGVHQFVNVGDGSMFQFGAGLSTHAPPFCLYRNGMNRLVALNAVGLRRNPRFTDQDRDEVKQVFRAVYRTRGAASMQDTLAELAKRDWGDAAADFIRFFHQCANDPDPRRARRGMCARASHRGD